MATTDLSQYDKEKIPNAETFRFGIVVSDWNQDITYNLLEGAVQTLTDLGAKREKIDTFFVPGSVELVYTASQLCRQKKFDALIIIGCVIRGETAHFDYVCKIVADSVTYLNTHQDTPVIFCLLTDNNKQQSIDRSGGRLGNKGIEAAVTAVRMAKLRKRISL
ncbi:MAG: 6,7-dimethyl-8-ribityllumazine synthase [Flavobacteriaceae bacterium]|jgi:6,7-dimethyl-8-ribityllumazine synthase|nr:6,7-dimethyl-8-ribityllumazine synthase [Flavobacteriaceae bacterium]